MKKGRIKWDNLLIIIPIFIACNLLIIHDLVIFATSTASYTLFGFITIVIAIKISVITGRYLYNEMQ